MWKCLSRAPALRHIRRKGARPTAVREVCLRKLRARGRSLDMNERTDGLRSPRLAVARRAPRSGSEEPGTGGTAYCMAPASRGAEDLARPSNDVLPRVLQLQGSGFRDQGRSAFGTHSWNCLRHECAGTRVNSSKTCGGSRSFPDSCFLNPDPCSLLNDHGSKKSALDSYKPMTAKE